MSKTGLIFDPVFCKHLTGPTHPERPERLNAIVRGLRKKSLWDRLVHLPTQKIEPHWMTAVHTEDYLERLETACLDHQPFIDCLDSAICPQSFEIAQWAAGSVLVAVDAVMGRKVHNAFCAVRPPGHHAESDCSMGFCLLNNIAIAAQFLLAEHGLERIFILDWDVHHGNGTQHTFESDPRVFFCSIHGDPALLYPGTGFPMERGIGPGEGTTLNIIMSPGAADSHYRAALEQQALPAARQFAPQFILVSAGFDAHAADPLAFVDLTTEGFHWMSQQVCALAEEVCGGRLVSILEGGYDLKALSDCVNGHVATLLGELP